MRVVVFFASLFFLLAGKNVVLTPGNGFTGNDISQELQTKNFLSFQFTGNYSFLSTNSLHKEDKILICEEVEDEDTNDASPRKYKTPVAFHTSPYYQLRPAYSDNISTTFESSSHQLTRRYIMLRTLRI